MQDKPSAKDITEANRRFYDAIARVYEKVDTRRSGAGSHHWLHELLQDLQRRLRQSSNGRADRFMDVGAGTGFLAIQATEVFSDVFAADISQEMLSLITDSRIKKILAPADAIPLPNDYLDCVAAFATLHHLFDPKQLFQEAHRLLRSGGIFYSDHDISADFVGRFRWPLALYRRFFDHGNGYLSACPEATAKDYFLSEYHGDSGLSGDTLKGQLLSIGFRKVECSYHWEGMGLFAAIESIFPRSFLRRPGNSPIVRLIAVK